MADAQRRQADSPADGPGFIRSRGLRFPDDPDVLHWRVRRRLRNRQYEAREANAVRKLVGSEDVVLELGGGIGFLATLMARSCKARAVHSFEANPALIPYIERVYAANAVTTATVTNAVLGARKGRATFYEREDFLASSLAPDPPEPAGPVLREHEVEMRNVNAEIVRIKPTALVCDIEGAEAGLLPLADRRG